MTETQLNKQNLIKELNEVMKKGMPNIKEVRYDILNNGDFEFLVVEYNHGSKKVRNCTGTGFGYILTIELPKLLLHEYYDEVEWYDSMVNNSKK